MTKEEEIQQAAEKAYPYHPVASPSVLRYELEQKQKAFIAGANHVLSLQAKDEWISADDRLPEVSGFVLVQTPFCKCKVQAAFYNGIDWRSVDDKTEVWNITNWMPLPNPPAKTP